MNLQRLQPSVIGFGPSIVAIPVRDEAERIAACLRALADQRGATVDEVVLVVNNTTDRTVSEVQRARPSLPFRVHLVAREFAPDQADAGHARSLAMELAAERAGVAGILLTTDADGRVAPDWLATNLHHLRQGADAVAGRAVIDPVEAAAIPDALHEADARECAYAAVLDEVAALFDPEPADPWPRHTEHSGASICVTLDAYRRSGGMPAPPVGEDRAFVAALRRIDARIRHANDVEVTVSGRVLGRAKGGMADTIRRRMAALDPMLDDALEPASRFVRRVRLRGRLRQAWQARHAGATMTRLLLGDLGLDADRLGWLLARPTFGEAWEQAEACSPLFPRCRVPVAQLAGEMRTATALRDALRHRGPNEDPRTAELALLG